MEMRMRRGIGGREEEYQYLKYEEFLENFTWECSKLISTHQPKWMEESICSIFACLSWKIAELRPSILRNRKGRQQEEKSHLPDGYESGQRIYEVKL